MPVTTDAEPAVANFADVARRYCAWAETLAQDPRRDLIMARLLLSELHWAALRLPEVEPDDEETRDVVGQGEWKTVCRRFEGLPVAGYWDVFDPLKEEEKEPIFNRLPDDLADIYRDVKEGLHLYDAGRVNSAVWEWRFNFQIHWGQHLTGAQRAIHSHFAHDL